MYAHFFVTFYLHGKTPNYSIISCLAEQADFLFYTNRNRDSLFFNFKFIFREMFLFHIQT